ncbi:MAG: glycosyltransferase family 2 protein [Cyanobacteriota bacterium]|jgi:glycosyltransferase involved in cell wall biosynthesis
MLNNKVSVVIPVFNRAKYLREAVMSVLLQTHADIEIIIVDDGSTDNTGIVARELAIKWPQTVSLFWQSNSGPGPARELGTMKSKGEFIQYLDSDDILLPDKFQCQINALEENHQSEICYGISYEEDHSFNPPLLSGSIRATGNEIFYLFPKLLNERWWTTSCPLYKKSLINRLGPWKNLLNEEDWEFDARAASSNTLLVWVATGVSIKRINLDRDHLSYGGCIDREKLSHRVIAKQLLFQYAKSNQIKESQVEMKVFCRECFLLSRQCAIIGLEKQSKIMFNLSREAATKYRRYGIDYLVYRIFTSLIGWNRTGRLASKLRNMLC